MSQLTSLEILSQNENVLKVIERFNANDSHLDSAMSIINEINHAWAFPKDNLELSKYGQMGYMAEVGSPYQWWEDNCKSFLNASEKFPRSKDLNAVCMIASEALKPIKKIK